MLYSVNKYVSEAFRNQFRTELTWWCEQARLELELASVVSYS
jgi:hypothetical protein